MATRATIDEFFSHRRLALLRPSPKTKVMGAKIDEKLKPRGYELSVVYLDKTEGVPRLADVKDQVEGVFIAVPKRQCEAAVREAIDAGMPRIWLQAGSESKEAIALAEQNGVPTISGECLMMYAEPVEWICVFHSRLRGLFGRNPE